MITENGTIKTSTALDEKMQKELTRGSYKMSLGFIILGAIGVALFLTMEIVAIFLEWEDENFYILMTVLFAIILGSGISIMVMMNKNLKTVRGVSRVNTYEFYQGCFILTESLNGETVGSAKVYNNQIIKAKESKNYLFLYINAGAAYPVAKYDLSEAELNTLKSFFRLPAVGETVTLPQVSENNTDDKSDKSDEPFDEIK